MTTEYDKRKAFPVSLARNFSDGSLSDFLKKQMIVKYYIDEGGITNFDPELDSDDIDLDEMYYMEITPVEHILDTMEDLIGEYFEFWNKNERKSYKKVYLSYLSANYVSLLQNDFVYWSTDGLNYINKKFNDKEEVSLSSEELATLNFLQKMIGNKKQKNHTFENPARVARA